MKQAHNEEAAKQAPDSARQEKVSEYNKLSRRLLFLKMGISAILLLALLFTGNSAKLLSFLVFPLPWKAALYLLILMLGYGVIMAPIAYFQDFVLPHGYGLSIQLLKNWLTSTYLMPLFSRLNPLEEGALKKRLLTLAKRANVDIKNILSINPNSKATTANIMLIG